MTPDPDVARTARALLERLFPIGRSLTGDGVRETLHILGEHAPFAVREYASGTPAYDWTVPDEWAVRDAYIADPRGNRLVDVRTNALHLVGYSRPVRRTMTFAELAPHLHTLPELPDAIPYRTTYYRDDWGFCLTHRQWEAFDRDASYTVVVDSELKPGALTLADAVLPGTSGREYLVSTYCCHPSMANDNLSGLIVATLLCAELAARPRRHTWRFVVVPETIGALTYLAQHETAMKRLSGGFVATCCGGPGPYGYKESFLGDHLVDRAIRLAFRDAGIEPVRHPFVPDGSDERQYSSPGFRIPVATICKDKYYEYRYYHTSLDDLSFVTGEALAGSFALYRDAIAIVEENRVYRTLNPNGEPQLGRRGLYPQTGGGINQTARGDSPRAGIEREVDVIGWVMFLADGRHDLVAVAERSGLPFRSVAAVARRLAAHGLLEEASGPDGAPGAGNGRLPSAGAIP